tara:strand:- start:122 stop:325 length:204 start_codon:yes stop_codon:yes gene_type:complete
MTYKFRYAIQFIIEDPDYSGFDLGKSFIEEVEDLVLDDHKRISLITSSSEEVYEGERVLPIQKEVGN